MVKETDISICDYFTCSNRIFLSWIHISFCCLFGSLGFVSLVVLADWPYWISRIEVSCNVSHGRWGKRIEGLIMGANILLRTFRAVSFAVVFYGFVEINGS